MPVRSPGTADRNIEKEEHREDIHQEDMKLTRIEVSGILRATENYVQDGQNFRLVITIMKQELYPLKSQFDLSIMN